MGESGGVSGTDPSKLDATRTTSVGVIDDDAIVRAWVRQSLRGSEFRIAGEAASVAEVAQLIERRRPDVLLVDFVLPDGSGTDVVQSLRRQDIATPVLVITASPRGGLNEAAREAGAQGVIQKRGDAQELIDALRRVVNGDLVVDPCHPRRPAGRAALSPREREVLLLVANGATNPEVAAGLGIGIESVKTLLKRTFTKLGAHNRMEAVSEARRQGFVS